MTSPQRIGYPFDSTTFYIFDKLIWPWWEGLDDDARWVVGGVDHSHEGDAGKAWDPEHASDTILQVLEDWAIDHTTEDTGGRLAYQILATLFFDIIDRDAVADFLKTDIDDRMEEEQRGITE